MLSRLAALVPPLAVPDRAQSNISSIDKSVTVLVGKPRSVTSREVVCEFVAVERGVVM